jgi:superfamily I DNA/RNA helicase
VQLNEEQQEAVACRTHALVLACAGSGKTRVLSEKCRFLLRDSPMEAIVAVTFTRDAAAELRRRILQGMTRRPRYLSVGTFHTLARDQLKRSGVHVRLLSPAEQMMMLRRAWSGISASLSWEEAVTAVERYKSMLQPLAKDLPESQIVQRYQDLLDQHRAADFADLLLLSVRGMLDGTVAPLPSRYLLVDECHDLDAVQYEWVRLHGCHGARITMVGDDDQSIYSWRAALGLRGMVRFEQEFCATRISLTRNYRCAPEIVSLADKLIRHNFERLPKTIVSAACGVSGQIEFGRHPDRQSEAQAVAAAVAGNPGSWAVLARTARQLDIIETTLTKRNMPYIRVGSSRFWQRPHIGSMLSALGSLLTGESLGYESLLAWAGMDEETVSQLRPVTPAKLSAAALLVTKNRRDIIESLSCRVSEWLAELVLERPRTALVVHAVADWFSASAISTEKRVGSDFALAADVLSDMSGTLAERLRWLQFQSRKRTEEGVVLMTLHGAKGLEFENVVLIGLEEGLLPHAENPDVAEERRLAYVGMTRARKFLMLTMGGKAAPSRFLRETGLVLGQECAA